MPDCANCKGARIKQARMIGMENEGMIAAIRLRSRRGIRHDIESTMSMLNLHNKYYCSLLRPVPSTVGMLEKVKDFITWGEVSSELAKTLVEKRGEKDPKDSKRMKKFFRLHPPTGGFRSRGMKAHYTRGGDLGYRGEKINDLLKRMI
jgi:large subunit ribosomal protein L30